MSSQTHPKDEAIKKMIVDRLKKNIFYSLIHYEIFQAIFIHVSFVL